MGTRRSVVDHDVLGDFEGDSARIGSVMAEDAVHVGHQPRILQLSRRHVDTELQLRKYGLPVGELPACLLENEASEWDDQPRLLSERDELVR
jgi:hypothetical protein